MVTLVVFVLDVGLDDLDSSRDSGSRNMLGRRRDTSARASGRVSGESLLFVLAITGTVGIVRCRAGSASRSWSRNVLWRVGLLADVNGRGTVLISHGLGLDVRALDLGTLEVLRALLFANTEGLLSVGAKNAPEAIVTVTLAAVVVAGGRSETHEGHSCEDGSGKLHCCVWGCALRYERSCELGWRGITGIHFLISVFWWKKRPLPTGHSGYTSFRSTKHFLGIVPCSIYELPACRTKINEGLVTSWGWAWLSSRGDKDERVWPDAFLITSIFQSRRAWQAPIRSPKEDAATT